jgi:hypothetical protein
MGRPRPEAGSSGPRGTRLEAAAGASLAWRAWRRPRHGKQFLDHFSYKSCSALFSPEGYMRCGARVPSSLQPRLRFGNGPVFSSPSKAAPVMSSKVSRKAPTATLRDNPLHHNHFKGQSTTSHPLRGNPAPRPLQGTIHISPTARGNPRLCTHSKGQSITSNPLQRTIHFITPTARAGQSMISHPLQGQGNP